FLEAGYFEAAAFGKPLLHTWSLAVEEQFYIVAPLLLMALARFGGRAAVWLGGLTVLSFTLSALTTASYPTAAYYLLPWRAWELGIGAMLALGVGPRFEDRTLREAAAALGLVLILAAVVLLDKSTPFPGAAALAPTLGAALILQAGRFGPTRIGRLLSTRPFVAVGLVSYSLYLWHWPLIVGLVYVTADMPSAGEAAAIFALSMALAWASWRFVERPFRDPRAVRRPFVFAGTAAAMAALIAGGAALWLSGGAPGRLPEEARRLAAFSGDRDPRMEDCVRGKGAPADWAAPCLYGPGEAPARVALWGDSHASALIPGLAAAAEAAGGETRVALYARFGCPPVADFEWWLRDEPLCPAFLDASREAILDDPTLDLVVLVARAALFTEGWFELSGFGETGRAPVVIGDAEAPLPEGADRTAFFMKGLEEHIVALKEAGKAVALVYPIPEAGDDVPSILAKHVLRGGDPGSIGQPRAHFDERNARILAEYDRLAERYGLATIRPHEALCDEARCRFVADGASLYYDKNHLSVTGARWIAPLFADLFKGLGAE
ncbi:MAG: acyltransferase family protein, partial [Pseudomonadota bacterium]